MNLRFACQPGCSACCEVKGFVYITEQDLTNIAAHVGVGRAAFEKRYVVRFRHMLRLRKPRGSQCHFLKSGRCAVHAAKPVQCRLYPLWPELVEIRANWQAESKRCPGIGKGELIQIGTACQTAAEMKLAYPKIYEKN